MNVSLFVFIAGIVSLSLLSLLNVQAVSVLNCDIPNTNPLCQDVDSMFNLTYQTWAYNQTPTSTTYYANNSAVSGGSYTDTNVINRTFWYDGDTLNFSEGSGTNPLDVMFNFTNVTGFSQLIIREYYTGSTSHDIQVQIWDYPTASWQSYFDFVGQSGFNIITIPVYDSGDHINNTNVSVRLHHVQNGISSHRLYIDFIWLVNGNNIGASTNLIGYAQYLFGYNNFFGYGNFTGDIGNFTNIPTFQQLFNGTFTLNSSLAQLFYFKSQVDANFSKYPNMTQLFNGTFTLNSSLTTLLNLRYLATNPSNFLNATTIAAAIDNSTIARTTLVNIFTKPNSFQNVTLNDWIVCPSRVAELSGEKLSCSNFSCTTGWDRASGWTIANNKATKINATSTNLTANATIVTGTNYRLTYTISDLHNSNIKAYVGGVAGTLRTAIGTYTEDFLTTSTNNLTFVYSGTDTYAGFGSELVGDPEFTSSDFWYIGGGFQITGGQAVCSVGGCGLVEYPFGSFVTAGGLIYQVILDIASVNTTDGGFVEVQLGGNYSDPLTSVGVNIFNITSVDTTALNIACNAYDCTLNSISVKKYSPTDISNLSLSNSSLKNITIPAGKVCWFDGATKASAYYLTSDPSTKSSIKLADNSSSVNFYSFLLKSNLLSGTHYGLMADEVDSRCIKYDEETKTKNIDFGCLIGLNTLNTGKNSDRLTTCENEIKKIKDCAKNSLDYKAYQICIGGLG